MEKVVGRQQRQRSSRTTRDHRRRSVGKGRGELDDVAGRKRAVEWK